MIVKEKHILFLLICLFCGLKSLYSQDEFIQNMDQIPSYINPSFHAFNEGTMVGVVNEFSGKSSFNATENKYGFFNNFFSNNNFGIGMDILSTRLRNSAYQNTKFNLSYIYRVQLNRFWIFYPAVTAGYSSASFNYNNIVFQDQIDVLTGDISNYTIDPIILSDRVSSIDFGVSFLVHNRKNTLFGVSAKHINRPKYSFVKNDDDKLNMLISSQLGYQFHLNKYNRRGLLPRYSYLYLYNMATKQGDKIRIDFYQQLIINEFSIGLNQHINTSQMYDTGELGISTSLHIENMLLGLNYKMPLSPKAKKFIPNVIEIFLKFDLSSSRGRRNRNYSRFYSHQYRVF